MKKRLLLFMVGMMTVSALAGPAEAPVVTLPDIESLESQVFGKDGLIVHIPANTELELLLDLQGDVVQAERGKVELEFEKALFVYFSPDRDAVPQFSWNRKDWKEWKDMFGGSLSVGVAQPSETLRLNLKLNSK